jgi:hypothetical protein
MYRLTSFSFLAGLFLAMIAGPAAAQATRTWVSGVGDDVNPCSRTAPCKTFAGAISKTAASGEINCLDSAGFGAVTITKSISIICEGVIGGIVVAGTNGIVINAAATDEIYLKGLDIFGTFATPGLNGIRVLSAGYLHVEDCVIRDFVSASPNGVGIQIATTVNFKFVIARTSLTNNGSGSTGAGIQIKQTAGSVSGVIDRVIADRNVFGIAADGTANVAGTNITIRDSNVSNNTQTGILSVTGATGTGILTSRTTVSNNLTGVATSGAGAVLRIGSSEITGNTTGVSGTVLSYGDNKLNGNGTDGTLTLVPGGTH